jgi:hypothetical protein
MALDLRICLTLVTLAQASPRHACAIASSIQPSHRRPARSGQQSSTIVISLMHQYWHVVHKCGHDRRKQLLTTAWPRPAGNQLSCASNGTSTHQRQRQTDHLASGVSCDHFTVHALCWQATTPLTCPWLGAVINCGLTRMAQSQSGFRMCSTSNVTRSPIVALSNPGWNMHESRPREPWLLRLACTWSDLEDPRRTLTAASETSIAKRHELRDDDANN